jgi:hypothetical protein
MHSWEAHFFSIVLDLDFLISSANCPIIDGSAAMNAVIFTMHHATGVAVCKM